SPKGVDPPESPPVLASNASSRLDGSSHCYQVCMADPCTPRNFYCTSRIYVKKKSWQEKQILTRLSDLRLYPLSQRLEPVERRLPDRSVRSELTSLPESRLGLVPAILGDENEAEIVVRRLHLRVETDREAQGLLGFSILLQVVQGQTQVLVRRL